MFGSKIYANHYPGFYSHTSLSTYVTYKRGRSTAATSWHIKRYDNNGVWLGGNKLVKDRDPMIYEHNKRRMSKRINESS